MKKIKNLPITSFVEIPFSVIVNCIASNDFCTIYVLVYIIGLIGSNELKCVELYCFLPSNNSILATS